MDDRITKSPATPKPEAPPPGREGRAFARLEAFGLFVWFALGATRELLFVWRRPGEFVGQLANVLLGALPLGLTAGVATGVVVWLQLRDALQSVGGPGAVQYLPQALALAVVLELAPITAGLLVAGRTGASLGAELGSMRITEQIDALEVLGLSPLRELVAPRVAACAVALPVLTMFISYTAVGTGYLGEALGGHMSGRQYLNECLRVLKLNDVIPATIKTAVFGWLTGLVGCWAGLRATGGTEGVGKAATTGVVVSIFVVLVADVVLVKFIKVFV
jgi:phospholipid/cholesterol/gamma-HCH transport system permease protein